MQCSGSRSLGAVSFWPPRSESRSGSFHQQAKKWRKFLISRICDLLITCYLWTLMYVPTGSNKKKYFVKNIFLFAYWKPSEEQSIIQIRICIRSSVVLILGSGPVSNFHRSGTLVFCFALFCFWSNDQILLIFYYWLLLLGGNKGHLTHCL